MGKYGDYVKRSLILGGSSPVPSADFSRSRFDTDDASQTEAIAKMRAVLSGQAPEPPAAAPSSAGRSPGPARAQEPLPTLVGSKHPEARTQRDAQLYPHASQRAGEAAATPDDEERLQQMRGVLGTELSFRGPTPSLTAVAAEGTAAQQGEGGTPPPLVATSQPAAERVSFRERVEQGAELQTEIAAAEVPTALQGHASRHCHIHVRPNEELRDRRYIYTHIL